MNFRLLVNYLSDECSEGEKEYVEHWAESDPKNNEFLESLRKVWEVRLNDKIEINAEQAWKTFKNDVIGNQKDNTPAGPNPSPNYSSKFDTRYLFLHVAAAAALILFVFLFLSEVHIETEKHEKEQFTMREIITEKGEKSRIKLSDGTNVILNADSRIQIPSQFVGDSREVHLRGEAHFEVTKQNGKPFIVWSGYSYTKVLGTSFIVSAYPTDNKIVVAVEEGKVQIGKEDNKNTGSTNNKTNIAIGGDVGVLYKGKGPIISKVEDIERYTSWANGELVFKNTPLKEIVPRIERWYDIIITIDDLELYDRQLTAKFRDEPLTEVLKVMALSMNMKYNRERDTVTFFNEIQ